MKVSTLGSTSDGLASRLVSLLMERADTTVVQVFTLVMKTEEKSMEF